MLAILFLLLKLGMASRSRDGRGNGVPLREIFGNSNCESEVEGKGGNLWRMELQRCQEENYKLRIKCGKLDQIEKYSDIIVASVDQFKRKNQQLEKKVSEVTRERDQLRNQIKTAEQQHPNIHESSRHQSRKQPARKNSQIQQNYQVKRMQEELAFLKQNQQKTINNLEIKHKNQLLRVQSEYQQQIQNMQKSQTSIKQQFQCLLQQNGKYRVRQMQGQQKMKSIQQQNARIQIQLKKYRQLSFELDQQVQNQLEILAKVESDSLETITALRREIQALKLDLQTQINSIVLLQKMNVQLKNQGGVLIRQNNQMRGRVLQLQQANIINVDTIDKLYVQIELLRGNCKYQEERLVEMDIKNKQLLDILERDNIGLRKENQGLRNQMETKMKQIQDLILISGQLEEDGKNYQQSAENNYQTIVELKKVVADTSQLQNQICKLKDQLKTKQELLDDFDKGYGELKQKLQLMEEKQEAHLTYKQVLIENGRRIAQLQSINERISDKISDYENIIEQLQNKYEAASNQISIKQKQNEHKLQNLKQQFAQQKQLLLKQSMTSIQQLINQKYQTILYEYKQHFTKQIKQLQHQVAILNKPSINQPSQPQLVQSQHQ